MENSMKQEAQNGFATPYKLWNCAVCFSWILCPGSDPVADMAGKRVDGRVE
jgi:hypothetical protein